MKRSKFIAAIFGAFGVARAQQTGSRLPETTTGNHLSVTTCAIPPQWNDRCPAILNNQCPVCGTMAEPLPKLQKIAVGNCKATADPGVVACEDIFENPYSSLTRCKRCNAAFWQDSEGK